MTVQLLVYEFGPEARFEGQLGGALGRFETGGALKILEAVFIARDAETGERAVISLRGDGIGGLIAPILDFRLDPAARRKATRKALDAATPGLPAETLEELGSDLVPGAALAALLIEHRWAEALEDAVARTGGSPLGDEFVEARTLSDAVSSLRSAAGRRGVSVGQA